MSVVPPTQITKPETFILESLRLEDEEKGRLDGRILYDILRLHGKSPIYYYFRTQAELIKLSDIFRGSGYRYLHLSCHGNAEQLAFTFSSTDFTTFASIFEKKLNNRRLFISGCNLGTRPFAEAMYAMNGGMYSVTAPTKKVFFDQTTAFWSAFYYLMHAHSSKEMKMAQLADTLTKLSGIFEMPIAHYFKNTSKKAAIDELVFTGKQAVLVVPAPAVLPIAKGIKK